MNVNERKTIGTTQEEESPDKLESRKKNGVDEETLLEVMISEIHRGQRKTLKVDDMRFLAFLNTPDLVG